MPVSAQVQPAGVPSAQVWYVELRGAEAAGQLLAVMEELPSQPGFLGAELLTSPAQPALALLASRWAAALPVLDLPAGAKAWSFVVVATR